MSAETSEHPSAASSTHPGPRLPPAADGAAFLGAMQSAGLLGELDEATEAELLASESGTDLEALRIDLLLRYYRGTGPASAARRREADRFFVHREGDLVSAHDLVTRIGNVLPELEELRLTRIGKSEDGALVLRAGEHFAAVTDDYEEELETGEVDIWELDAVPTITVRGIVRAVNVLLDRVGLRERLVEVRGDGRREAYVGVNVTDAVGLCKAGYLEEVDPERVMDFAGW